MRLFRSLLMGTAFVVATGFVGDMTVAQACPGCKTANETNANRPRAYMMSILFMLGMPATVFAGFSLAFYRLSRKAAMEAETLAATEEMAPSANTEAM